MQIFYSFRPSAFTWAAIALVFVLTGILMSKAEAQDMCGLMGQLYTNTPLDEQFQRSGGPNCAGQTYIQRGGDNFFEWQCINVDVFQSSGLCPDTYSHGGRTELVRDPDTNEVLANFANCVRAVDIGFCATGVRVGDQCIIEDAPDCLCDVDLLPANTTGDGCDREALQFCEGTQSFIPASALCVVNDCTDPIYAQLNEAECAVVPDEPEVGNTCTGDFYTDPISREIVCGTFMTTHDNGASTDVSTDQNGTTTVTNTSPDGTVTETTQFPDGSSNTTVTTPTGVVSGTSTNQTDLSPIAGAGTDSSCPANVFVLLGGQLVCSSVLPEGTNTDGDTGTATRGGSCDVAPACNGDAIACANFHENWLQRCSVENQTEDQDFDLDAPFADAGFTEVFGEEIPIIERSLTEVAFDASGFLPSSLGCPSLGSFNAAGTIVSFDINLLCDLAEKLGFLVVAFAYFIGARIVLQAF